MGSRVGGRLPGCYSLRRVRSLTDALMRILLVGHGRMGRLVGSLAAEYGCEVMGVIDPQSPLHAGGLDQDRWRDVEVAIDFTFPDAVKSNVEALARLGVNMVVGTTGWAA